MGVAELYRGFVTRVDIFHLFGGLSPLSFWGAFPPQPWFPPFLSATPAELGCRRCFPPCFTIESALCFVRCCCCSNSRRPVCSGDCSRWRAAALLFLLFMTSASTTSRSKSQHVSESGITFALSVVGLKQAPVAFVVRDWRLHFPPAEELLHYCLGEHNVYQPEPSWCNRAPFIDKSSIFFLRKLTKTFTTAFYLPCSQCV